MRALSRSLAPIALFGLLFLSACAATNCDDETNHGSRCPPKAQRS